MLKLAREMSLSESTLVVPSTGPQADSKVRFFTPTAEIAFVGILLGYLFRLEPYRSHRSS